jgi:hypothetical protein
MADRQTLDQLVLRMEPNIRRAFMAAIRRSTAAIDYADLVAAIEAGRIEDAIIMLEIKPAFVSPIVEAMRDGFLIAGAQAENILPVAIRAKFGFGMNPRAAAWAESRSADLVEGINGNLPVVRELIRQSVNEGIPARRVALDITGRVDPVTKQRSGGLLGLNSPQTDQVIRARAMLSNPETMADYFSRDAETGALIPRYKLSDRRFDKLILKAIKDGKPLAKADLDKIMDAHKRKAAGYRGRVIARTEALNSLRAGQHEGFKQMVEANVMGPGFRLQKEWQTRLDGRERPHHHAMNGVTLGFDDLFITSIGGILAFPGDVDNGAGADDLVQCRCAAVYRWVKHG